MTIKHLLAMIAGGMVGKWVRDLALQLGLGRAPAGLAAMIAGSMVTGAIATA
jgi:hypothetical protein